VNEKTNRHGLWVVKSKLVLVLAIVNAKIAGQRLFVEWDGFTWQVIED
jgi:hypothetical protein